ncbi:MAG: hypothetical protein GC204_18835 [Chloroflexi bacterium]|nr:hypothetical protein [Chloroflexota bacterium]
MPDFSDDPQAFLDFINNQLDFSGLSLTSESDVAARLSEAEIENLIMPLIREDIQQETLKLVAQLLRTPQRDYWRAQLAPLHREMRQCLAQTLAAVMQQRYPNRMNDDEWLDVANFIITMAWLVRKQMDGGDPALPD